MKLASLVVGGAAALSTLAVADAQPAQQSPLSPSPASGTGLPRNQCIERHHDFRGHTVVDRRTLLVDVSNRVYRLTFSGDCLNTTTRTDPVAFRRLRNLVCRPSDLQVTVGRGGAAGRCLLDSIVMMPPAEVAALPARLRP